MISAPRVCRQPRPSVDQEEGGPVAPISAGDRAARDLLVEGNLGLVDEVARDYRGRGLPLDDLIGEGNLGLIRAAERFDARFEASFRTYAVYWIQEAILRALIDTAPLIRLPKYMTGLLRRWRETERALRREGGGEPGPSEVAARLGLSEDQRENVARAIRARRTNFSRYGSRSAADVDLEESLPWHERPDATTEDRDELAMITGHMECLTARERAFIELRYGPEGDGLKIVEIARRLGVCRDWVPKLEARALGKLAKAVGTPDARVGD